MAIRNPMDSQVARAVAVKIDEGAGADVGVVVRVRANRARAKIVRKKPKSRVRAEETHSVLLMVTVSRRSGVAVEDG